MTPQADDLAPAAAARPRRRLLAGLATTLGPCLVEGLFHWVPLEEVGRERVEAERRAGPGIIYAFWHESLLACAYAGRGQGIRVLISLHADGEAIARIVRRLGFAPVRGSSTRGGAGALRALLSCTGHDLAITPDGPRGPRRQVQAGLVQLAGRTGRAIIPVGVGYRRAWRLNSWDRFLIPKPGTRAVLLYGEPLAVPRRLAAGEVAPWCQRVAGAIEAARRAAERRAGALDLE